MIAAVPTDVELVAVVVQLALPVTPEVPNVSPFLKPLSVAVKVGLAAPYARFLSSAVTVKCALVIVNCPLTKFASGKSWLAAGRVGALTTVIGYGLPATELAVVAVVDSVGAPVTPALVVFSPFTKPLSV